MPKTTNTHLHIINQTVLRVPVDITNIRWTLDKVRTWQKNICVPCLSHIYPDGLNLLSYSQGLLFHHHLNLYVVLIVFVLLA